MVFKSITRRMNEKFCINILFLSTLILMESGVKSTRINFLSCLLIYMNFKTNRVHKFLRDLERAGLVRWLRDFHSAREPVRFPAGKEKIFFSPVYFRHPLRVKEVRCIRGERTEEMETANNLRRSDLRTGALAVPKDA